MTILKIAGAAGLFVGLAGTVWGIASHEMGQSHEIRGNQEVIDSVEKGQQQIRDWMNVNIQQQRKNAAQLEVLRQLCADGQLPLDNPNCVKVSAPPMKAPPAKP